MFKFALAALMAIGAQAAGGTDYTQNGANWPETDPLCGNGVEQSPIDLSEEGASRSASMELNGYGYRDFTLPAEGADLVRAVDKVYSPVSDGEFHLSFADGTKSIFKVLQFHFHAPSEHSVNGELYDLEVHFVHLYADTNGLGGVIGVFFDRTAGNYDNDFLTKFWEEGDNVDVNVASFLSNVDFSEYWNYPGSLTTPPCTEGVKWTVIKDVQPISDEQLK
jgi:carbonic anhydrase